MEEIWKEIQNFEGYYEVSNFGQVRSLTRIIHYTNGHNQIFNGKMLIPQKTTHGYFSVKLSKNGVVIRKHIHDLVASAFLPNPNNFTEVNHKDHNKLNNSVDNLEWISHRDNIKDMVAYNIKIGKFQESIKHNNKYVSKQLLDMCPICGKIKYKSGNMCLDCYKKIRSQHLPNKEQLKNDLLCRNFTKIGNKYGVSYTAIKKWCKKYGLPYLTKEIKEMTDNDILSL